METRPPPRRSIQVVALDPPVAAGAFRWEAETRGLVTALVEAGLADLKGVAPEVDGVARSPGLAERVATGAESWTGTLNLGTDPGALVISLDLCDPIGACDHHEATGTREAPFGAVSDMLGSAAAQLHRQVPEAAQARWEQAPSADPYAILLLGRAAATLYGFLPPPDPEQRGHTRLDPFARCVFLDPGMHLAWWIVGRDAAQRGEPGRAVGAFEMTLRQWPERVLYQADLAAAQFSAGEAGRAVAAWSALPPGSERDPRFTVAWARAALTTHDTNGARSILAALPHEVADDPAVVALQVDLAIGDGVGEDVLALLRKWATVAPSQPEPVEREIAALMELGRGEEAAALLPELTRRGRAVTANTLAIPLALERGSWVEAEQAARNLDWVAVADHVSLRAELEADPLVQPIGLLWSAEEDLVLVRATRWLAREAYTDALADAEQILAAHPWSPGGLWVATRARRGLGDTVGADEALARLAQVDPEGLFRQERARLGPESSATVQGTAAGSPGEGDSSSGAGSVPGATTGGGAGAASVPAPGSVPADGSASGASGTAGEGASPGAASPAAGAGDGEAPAPSTGGSSTGVPSPEGPVGAGAAAPPEGASAPAEASGTGAGGPSTAAGAHDAGMQSQEPPE